MDKVQRFIEKANTKYENKYDYSKVIYSGCQKPVTIICPVHSDFEQTPDVHIHSKYGCPKCAKEEHTRHTTFTTEDFIEKARAVHGDRYSYLKTVYTHSSKRVIISCPIHGEFEQLPWSHIGMKCGCPKCLNWNRTTEDFIEEARSIHGDKYDYSKALYVNCNTKIEIICPKHGSFWQTSSCHILSKHGCPKCRESKGELFIRRYLEKRFITYRQQFTFSDCVNKKVLLFDFYLPDYNICIEYDGEQHFRAVKRWGGQKGLIERQERDQIKNKYCKDNNIKLIRISYKQIDEVEDILEKELSV